MTANGKRHPPRPKLEIKQSAASPEEAAAIAAAIEQFIRETAPAPSQDSGPTLSPWLEAGLLEGTGREPSAGAPWGKLGDPLL
ncbi:MAG TPA: hypothetical protein VEW67_09015 [Thermoleophilaceae bacterium]|nr:hypothetical protein [Thermoleophilaceae bacterium]